MTAHAGYLITLDHNIDADDATDIITALSMIKGVIAVEPVNGNSAVMIAQYRADTEWRQRIAELLTQVTP